MRYDGREIAQMNFLAEQRPQKLEQGAVREHLRPAEGTGQAQREIVARTSNVEKPVRRRLLRFALHGGPIQRSELGDVLTVHGLDGGERKRSAQQDAAVLIESRVRCALGLRSEYPAGGLARRDGDDPIHLQLPDNRCANVLTLNACFVLVPGAAQHLHSASKTRVNTLLVWCAAEPGPFRTLAFGTVPDQRSTAPHSPRSPADTPLWPSRCPPAG